MIHDRVRARRVCVPRFSFVSLLIVRARQGRGCSVYVDLYPRYVKVLLRWCRVPERLWLRLASWLTGLDIRRAVADGNPRGSPARNLDAMKRVSVVMEALSNDIAADGWVRLLKELVDDEPAAAYFHRRFPWDDVWPYFLAVALTREAVGDGGGELLVAWHPTWSHRWSRELEDEMQSLNARLFKWPRWYERLAAYTTNAVWTGRSVVSIVSTIARHGVRAQSPTRVLLAIEFIESQRLGAGPNDTNFLEDDHRIRREDILLFLTRHHERVLRRTGRHVAGEVQDAHERGFRVVRLRDLAYAPESTRRIGTAMRHLLAAVAREGLLGVGSPALAHSYWRAWLDLLSWQLLFDAYAPASVLHTQNPNGHTDGRFDSALLTGLARRAGGRSVGYQNRILYDRVYEDSFDCYDVYLAWGARWRELLGSAANRFIGEIVPVGCLNNGGIAEAIPEPAPDRGPRVVIFTNELGGNLFPASVTLNFLHACMRLAEDHPECSFRVKTKDPEMVDALLACDDLRRHYEQVSARFEFLRLPRHETASVIAGSDIVIATAWTTPGSDALLLGKRVLFYNELRSGGLAFHGLPDLVATSPDELRHLFDEACRDYSSYTRDHAEVISELDPFRDGNVRQRAIRAVLGGEPVQVHTGS